MEMGTHEVGELKSKSVLRSGTSNIGNIEDFYNTKKSIMDKNPYAKFIRKYWA